MAGEKEFASQADLAEKKVTFERLSEHAYAYTAEGDPNTGIVIGDDAVLVADTQATPVMAQDVKGLLARRFDAHQGTFYLLRPLSTSRCALVR